jgi:hypothetical protein
MHQSLRGSAVAGTVRRVIAWSTGILVFLFGMMGQEIISSNLGLVAYIDFGETIVFERPYYERVSDGAYTWFGWATMILIAMFSARIGMAVFRVNWRGGVQEKSEIDFLAWTYGLLVFAVFAGCLDLVLGHQPGWIQVVKNLLNIGVIALVAKPDVWLEN